MLSKNGLIILSLFSIIGLLASCLGSTEYDEIPYTKDAEILSFSLSNDSITALSSVVFSIDQNRNLIYNHDSMAYLTEIKYKAIVTYTSAAGESNILNITDGDSTWVRSGDSIDVSKPLLLKSYASDGETTKIYTFKLNIHQIDPDSVQYKKAASDQDFLQCDEIQMISFMDKFYTFTKTGEGIKLYASSNAVDWAGTSLRGLPANTDVRGIKSSGEKLFAYTEDGGYYESADAVQWTKIEIGYPIVSILGFLKLSEGQPLLKEGLSLTVKKDNQTVFAFLSDAISFGDTVPSGFPISDFASFNNTRLKLGYLTVIGGLSTSGNALNKVWSTGNGLYWAELTNTNTTHVFPPLQGASILHYNAEYWILNGKLNDGSYNREVYFSEDGGVTWTLKPEKCWTPENYTPRYYATSAVDRKGIYFYILGGKSEDFLPEIWTGHLNRQAF
jgi:hypothetical protein